MSVWDEQRSRSIPASKVDDGAGQGQFGGGERWD